MAGADVIEAAIGIMLLLLVSYVVLGNITTAADTVSTARKDMTLLQEERLNTKIAVVYADQSSEWQSGWGSYYSVYIMIKNTGNTIIDISKLDIIVMTDGSPQTIYCKTMGDGWNLPTTSVGTWNYDGIYLDDAWGDYESVNFDQWDPGEYLYVWIGFYPDPREVWAFTPNGATGHFPVT